MATLVALGEVGVRSHVSEPERGRRCWQDKKTGETPPEKRAAQRALYANRRRVRGRRGRRLQRCRGEVVERTFAHMYETGGMRRVWVRGHANVRKRVLIQAAACNIGLLLRRQTGVGTPRSLQGRAVSAICRLIGRLTGHWGRLTRASGGSNGHRWRSSAQSIIAKLPEEQGSANRLLPRAVHRKGYCYAHLRREKGRLQRKRNRLQRENDRLKQENEHLKRQLDEAGRAGRRQAAPFAKDRPQGRGRRPGRRPGAGYGRHGCRPRPARVHGQCSWSAGIRFRTGDTTRGTNAQLRRKTPIVNTLRDIHIGSPSRRASGATSASRPGRGSGAWRP